MRVTHSDATRIARFGEGAAVMHVRFAGQRFDVPLATLEVAAALGDRRIKTAVADYLSLPAGAMEAYIIDRHANGDLTIRPAAVCE